LTDEELREILLLACELRQRVREQLHLMAPGEYDKVQLGVKLLPSGTVATPTLPDAGRVQRISLPETPSVGEVVGLAVEGDHGCILRFEMQATRGSGRIVPLGSIQHVMRESTAAAAQYIHAKSAELGISTDFRQSKDIAVLATFMGQPKEGPSAGIAMVVGIISALKGQPVRNDVAMTGEITIMGKVLPVGGIQQKLRAAVDAGVKEALIPLENLREAEGLPQSIRGKIKICPVQSIQEALPIALLPNGGGANQGNS
jgi:ATP-dependent Lon protease